MVDKELDVGTDDCKFPNVRKTYWQSATWNVHAGLPSSSMQTLPVEEEEGPLKVPLQTPRSQGHNTSIRSRVPLLPLQPLSIARKSFDDWPSAGLDDAAGLRSPITPGRRRVKAELDIKLDLASVHRSVVEPTEIQLRRDKFALFDKQCSRVANYHIYLGSDAVARDREILRANGVTHVLNCVGFVCPEYFKGDLIYKTLWLQDSPCEDITSLLYDVFDYFEEIREQGGHVFVHCCQGVSRSTSLVIAYVMWREHSCFEEAFQAVKAARGVANPNMGFACQLLQFQKRVYVTPMSPKSSLRMYRLAPHSPYDPLHLVPKASSNPGAGVLDSRGAFILHVPCAVLVWVGHDCDPMMAQAAEEGAYQIIRYERAKGPVKVLLEGSEGTEFWEFFRDYSQQCSSKECVGGNHTDPGSWAQNSCKSSEDELEILRQLGVGNRKIPSNDFDYNLYQMARLGGVIPPVSCTGSTYPTCVPVLEDGWGILRHKFLSLELAAVNQKSSSERTNANDLSPNTSMCSSSPLFSPFSVTSASSCAPVGSESSFGSPLSSLATLSPITPEVGVDQTLLSASHPHWFIGSLPIVYSQPTSSKSPASSLAQRRGSTPPVLQLPSLDDVPPPVPRGASRKPKLPPLATTENHRAENGAVELQDIDLTASRHVSSSTLSVQSSNSTTRDYQCEHDFQIGSSSAVAASYCSHSSKLIPEVGFPFLYLWPGLERIDLFDADHLDTRSVFVLVDLGCHSTGNEQGINVHVWVGRQLAANKESPSENSSNKEALWHQVGLDFVERMHLPGNVSVNVVREGQEPEEFWNAFNQA